MKYEYKRLYVRGSEKKRFGVHELQDAIQYLRSQPEALDPRLIAKTKTTIGPYTLFAEPALALDQLNGKSPDEIWCAFDAEVDLWAAGLEATLPRNGHSDTRD